MNFKLFKELNKEQKEAVKYTDGPSLILAGAGSGKTQVLTQKAIFLIKEKQVSPENILMVTFTNKAAAEMRERIKYHLGFIGTFHSFCAKVLRIDGERIGINKNFLIYDEDDQLSLLKEIIKKNIESEKIRSPGYFLNKISTLKNQLINEKQYSMLVKDPFEEKIAFIYREYQKQLKKNNALDFEDLIFKVVVLFSQDRQILNKYQERFKYILIDEFQDTNFAQYVLSQKLAEKYQHITVVGDFSQSIYSWRGAEIKNLEKFQEDFPQAKIFYLEKNYRSTQAILDLAYEIISKNQTHPILKLYTDNSYGEEVEFWELENEQTEAIFVAEKVKEMMNNGIDLKSIAVLYRMNAQSRVIEEAFLHQGIPYILIGGTRFYNRREIKDILSYLRLLVNPKDEISLTRIKKLGKNRWEKFKELSREIKDQLGKMETVKIIEEILQKTDYLDFFNEEDSEDLGRIENIKELMSVAINFPKISDFLEQVALVESEYFENEKKKRDKNGVYLMTLHQAKGLEFQVVFIVGVEEGILPHSRSSYDLFDLEEERRLFYVGITRAKERLYITYTKKRFFFGRRTYSMISRFLEDIEFETKNISY